MSSARAYMASTDAAGAPAAPGVEPYYRDEIAAHAKQRPPDHLDKPAAAAVSRGGHGVTFENTHPRWHYALCHYALCHTRT